MAGGGLRVAEAGGGSRRCLRCGASWLRLPRVLGGLRALERDSGFGAGAAALAQSRPGVAPLRNEKGRPRGRLQARQGGL